PISSRSALAPRSSSSQNWRVDDPRYQRSPSPAENGRASARARVIPLHPLCPSQHGVDNSDVAARQGCHFFVCLLYYYLDVFVIAQGRVIPTCHVGFYLCNLFSLV